MVNNYVSYFFVVVPEIFVSTQVKGWRVCFCFQFEGMQSVLVGKCMVAPHEAAGCISSAV